MKAEQDPTTTTMEPILGYYASYFSPREFEIAEILVVLPDIISELDYRPRIRVPWGHKKKRSALAVQDQKVRKSSSTVVRLRLPSSSSSPNPKIPVTNVVKVERSSPNTPLSFESEEKPNHCRSKVVVGKRKREEWQEVVDGLKKHKESLQKEIQNVKDHKEKLINFNLVLQSRKQELKKQRLIRKEAESQIQQQNLNLDIQLGQPTSIVICAPSIVGQEHYHQQIAYHQYQMHIMDHTAQPRRGVICENHAYLSTATQKVPSTFLPSNNVNATRSSLVSCHSNNGGSILVTDHGYTSDYRDKQAESRVKRKERLLKNKEKKESKDRVRSSSVAKDNGIFQFEFSPQ